ncbi:hypothetical protein C8246_04240 [Paracidovorax avenae]|uniref:hypothetical protein n=1 Tax=Paracidovorax avenae TaxID=80867 RepID=UPI000D1589C5|nr:hypothetical protein [Paracidovorax avenae]AVS77768.1 hypothetical protein C8234_06525 [Paracidovorax avenae]AVS81035.1 hypothetical protein C8237_07990 [Paracidovorax avenae]AVS91164.1 hypothetical protein C8246_04240 [Paracidovorax avenae]AVS98824.1 hypothetical protein C8236_08260 [Paracidovorax avenae]AVT12663.1 hypothetical protein C8235_07060 [Paracidovorax avenae]
MSDCNCNSQNNGTQDGSHVPNFALTGFAAAPQSAAPAAPSVNMEGVHALKLSVCVGGSYNQSTNQICFTIPIYGNLCFTSPIHIPVSAQIKVCAQTCGSFIPTGLRASVYLNGSSQPAFSVTVFGAC